jgi:hypothetical protein
LVQETPEESRETTPSPVETSERVGTNGTYLQSLGKALLEGRKGDREERLTLRFDTPLELFVVESGAGAASVRPFLGEHSPQ